MHQGFWTLERILIAFAAVGVVAVISISYFGGGYKGFRWTLNDTRSIADDLSGRMRGAQNLP